MKKKSETEQKNKQLDIVEHKIIENLGSYQKKLEACAKDLYSKFDSRFNPKVSVIAIVEDNNQNSRIVHLPSQFCITEKIKAKILTELIAHKKGDWNDGFYENWIGFKKNIEKAFKNEETFPNYINLPSNLKNIDGYYVLIVLGLQKELLYQNYYLTLRNTDSPFARESFLYSTTMNFFAHFLGDLNNKKDLFRSFPLPDYEDILVRGGTAFTFSLLTMVNPNIFNNLFRQLNTVSSEKYEGTSTRGHLVLAKLGHEEIRTKIVLESPFPLKEVRKTRKLLEMSDKNLIIHTDGNLVYGLCELRGNYNAVSESLFEIEFLPNSGWAIRHDKKALLESKDGIPYQPKECLDKNKFFGEISEVFTSINDRQIADLWEILTIATSQKHGTTIVISEHASGEANRLGKQCFQVNQFRVTKETIAKITSIDGAVLLDQNSYCHALGVILDGLAIPNKEDSSRGSRFNSAVRYLEQWGQKFATAILIVSEDGMVDLLTRQRGKSKVSHK